MMMTFPARLVAACVVAVSLYASNGYTASDYLLEIDGISGESTITSGALDILAYSYDVKAPRSAPRASSGGGGGAGKVSMSDISFSTKFGKASPQLMLACASGKHFPTAILTCRKAGGVQAGGETYLRITMSDVLVSSFSSAGNSADDVPMENFSLNFTRIEFNFTIAGVPAVQFSWDVAPAKKV